MTDTRNIDQTGPDYQPGTGPGTNGIGGFQIGVDPVGDIPAFNIFDTVLSQFANAPAITHTLLAFEDAADQTSNIDAFVDDIWNIETCGDYGLDVWGRIVGVNRVVQIPSSAWFGFAESEPGTLSWNTGVTASLSPAIGFAEAGSSWQSLGWGTFGQTLTWSESNAFQGGGAYFSGTGLTTNFRLSTEAYRSLILTKAAANITDCSIPSINQILLNLFPERGNAYVTDGYQGASYFGFAESINALPFNQGVFYNGQAVQSMVMTYTFSFPLSPVEMAIVSQSGVLPKPTGVLASIVINIH